jgi:hypothetical protein
MLLGCIPALSSCTNYKRLTVVNQTGETIFVEWLQKERGKLLRLGNEVPGETTLANRGRGSRFAFLRKEVPPGEEGIVPIARSKKIELIPILGWLPWGSSSASKNLVLEDMDLKKREAVKIPAQMEREADAWGGYPLHKQARHRHAGWLMVKPGWQFEFLSPKGEPYPPDPHE